ncbi:hypothetical protein VitviT2T_018608 [Vitis vinifera]|uniref:Uncharacterized protein n=1 Tax=Vitis vinifera TaxID=29760 RepID=A0ABY9CY65_VITVI|nr:hypothetical protein VitviT2T_018608 [Vitis vinifera]
MESALLEVGTRKQTENDEEQVGCRRAAMGVARLRRCCCGPVGVMSCSGAAVGVAAAVAVAVGVARLRRCCCGPVDVVSCSGAAVGVAAAVAVAVGVAAAGELFLLWVSQLTAG